MWWLVIWIYLFNLYKTIKLFIMQFLSPLIFVYRNNRNATLSYYFNKIDLDVIDTYHVIIYNNDDRYEIMFLGSLKSIDDNFIQNIINYDKVKRQNVMLLNDYHEVYQFDFNRLDKYYAICKKSGLNYINNLGEIMRAMGENTSFVQIINIRPFQKKINHVNDVTIDILYNN